MVGVFVVVVLLLCCVVVFLLCCFVVVFLSRNCHSNGNNTVTIPCFFVGFYRFCRFATFWRKLIWPWTPMLVCVYKHRSPYLTLSTVLEVWSKNAPSQLRLRSNLVPHACWLPNIAHSSWCRLPALWDNRFISVSFILLFLRTIAFMIFRWITFCWRKQFALVPVLDNVRSRLPIRLLLLT